MKRKLLLIEDDESLREVMSFHLNEAGWAIETAVDGADGLAKYDGADHVLVITDLKMPKVDGLEVVDRILARDPSAVVIVMTAYGNVDKAIAAMRKGAFHYVEKPVNMSAFLALLETASDHRQLRIENAQLRANKHAIIAASPAMNDVLRLVDKVAENDASILILGESGTGKELIARAVHERSLRRSKPFIAVNCAAIPDDLLESTLFGHKRGAFTGANADAIGKFRAAAGGTIFLDEIGEMSPRLQAKLLRVLQEGEIDVVGSAKPETVDVRIVAATHQDLGDKISDGSFRADLFYRLNVIPIRVPPLRERREDIPVLARHFLRKYAPERAFTISATLDQQLASGDWPGNIRELENAVRRMTLLSDGNILRGLEVHPAKASVLSNGLPFLLPDEGLDLFKLEYAVILAALLKFDGNQSATARYLNIPRHVLLYRLEKKSEDKPNGI